MLSASTIENPGKGFDPPVFKGQRFDFLSLETGTMPEFAPARAFYLRHGFEHCGPFAEYTDDPNSVFMTKKL